MKNVKQMQNDTLAILAGGPLDEKTQKLVDAMREYGEHRQVSKNPRSLAGFLFVVGATFDLDQELFDSTINQVQSTIIAANTGINPAEIIAAIHQEQARRKGAAH